MINRHTIISYNSRNIIDYLLVFLLISLSGNKAFGAIILVMAFLLSFIVFIYRNKRIDYIFLFFGLILTIILLLQAIKFDFFPWITIAGQYLIIFVAYFVVKAVGPTFVDKFIDIMIGFSVISLIFFLLENTIPGFANYLKSYAFTVHEQELYGGVIQGKYYLGIYTFSVMPYEDLFFIRNVGPFWEGGAFAGYLMIALIFNVVRTGKLFNNYGKILVITIITTLSTTGAIALISLIVFYLLAKQNYEILKWPLVFLVALIGMVLFTSLDILGAKVENRIKMAQQPGLIYTTTSSRFVDAVRDFHALQGHEIIGRGINPETRLSKIDKQSGYTIRTNGLTDHLVRFGTIFFIITFVLLYINFYSMNNYYHQLNNIFALFAVLIVILLLQSEVFFDYPVFWAMLFLYTNYRNHEEKYTPHSYH